jgi:hypothetical protein
VLPKRQRAAHHGTCLSQARQREAPAPPMGKSKEKSSPKTGVKCAPPSTQPDLVRGQCRGRGRVAPRPPTRSRCRCRALGRQRCRAQTQT